MNNRITKQLKKIAADLQPALKKVSKRHKGKDLLEKDPNSLDLKGNPVEPGKFYMIEEFQEVDHLKEVITLYKTRGMQAVGEYVVSQNENYEKNVLNRS